MCSPYALPERNKGSKGTANAGAQGNDNIERIWTIRNDHMVQDLPTQYAFVLVCCSAISQGVLIQFAVITTLQNSLCGTVEGHVFCTCPCLTLSNLGGKPTVMHVVGSAMDIF